MNISLCDNPRKWDDALLAVDGTLFHSWGWGETVASVGWRPWRVLAEEEGSPRAAVQIFEHRIPVLNASLLYARRGIASAALDSETMSAMSGWLRAFARKRKAVLLRLETSFPDSDNRQKQLLLANGFRNLPEQWSLWNAPRTTMMMDIRAPEGELLQRMRKSHRNCISRAQRIGLQVIESCSIEDLEIFYRLLLKSSERQKFPVRPFDYFLTLREHLMRNNHGRVILAKMDGQAVAGIICARFGSTCHNLYAGFDWSARQINANEPLQWAAIQWARQCGCEHYDMVGAGTKYPPKEGQSGYGLYNYKKGFGAELIYFGGYFDLASRPVFYSALRLAETHPGWAAPARAMLVAVRRFWRPSAVAGEPALEAPAFRRSTAPVEMNPHATHHHK